MQISPEFSSAAQRAPVPEFPLIWEGAGMDTPEFQDCRLSAMARARRRRLRRRKGRLNPLHCPGIDSKLVGNDAHSRPLNGSCRPLRLCLLFHLQDVSPELVEFFFKTRLVERVVP